MKEEIQKTLRSNKIIVLIGIIFFAFVGYKIISSNIQEKKEKAVLQESARLKELAKEPLNQCIKNINDQALEDIKDMRDLARDVNSEPAYSECRKSASGKINPENYCSFTYEEQAAEEQKILAKAKIDKEECYKQYK